jgi:hypothetical protein
LSDSSEAHSFISSVGWGKNYGRIFGIERFTFYSEADCPLTDSEEVLNS